MALFARGQQRAAERGLILVDTKYEFGTDKDGRIVLADEIHTPDSSRYWIAESYAQSFEAGARPKSFDKDFVRAWVTERCDPYKDKIPEIPADLVEQTSKVYIEAYETITGQRFAPRSFRHHCSRSYQKKSSTLFQLMPSIHRTSSTASPLTSNSSRMPS